MLSYIMLPRALLTSFHVCLRVPRRAAPRAAAFMMLLFFCRQMLLMPALRFIFRAAL